MDQSADQQATEHLNNTMERMLNHRFARINRSVWTALWTHFLHGRAFGLGSVIGATIVVYLLVIALSQLEFIPIIGEWASQIIAEINSAKTTSNN